MATAPEFQPDDLQADPLGDFVLVRTDQVDRDERQRRIDPVWARALGQVMRREGQRTPIEICRLPGATRWTLVSGGHRHLGAELTDIVYLRAEIVNANRDNRRMREVSENLWHKPLEPIDRAAFIAEAVAIHKRRAGIDPAKDGRVGSIAVRWQKALKNEALDTNVTMTGVYGFTDAVAAELGFSKSKVERDLMLYRRLVPSVVEDLRTARHPVATNSTQLRALAKLDDRQQRGVATRLLSFGAKNVAEGLAQFEGGKPAPDPEAKRLSAFIGAFSRMSLSEKKGALAHLAPMLPAEFLLIDPAAVVVPKEVSDALNAAFDLFLEVDKWDPAGPMAMLSEEMSAARGKVQQALMGTNSSGSRQ